MNTRLPSMMSYKTHDIRLLGTFADPWICANDVCAILEYKEDYSRKAIRLYVEDKDKKTGNELVETYPVKKFNKKSGRSYYVNESGLYDLVYSCKLPAAKDFKTYFLEELKNMRSQFESHVTTSSVPSNLPAVTEVTHEEMIVKLEEERRLRIEAEEKLQTAIALHVVKVDNMVKQYDSEAIFVNRKVQNDYDEKMELEKTIRKQNLELENLKSKLQMEQSGKIAAENFTGIEYIVDKYRRVGREVQAIPEIAKEEYIKANFTAADRREMKFEQTKRNILQDQIAKLKNKIVQKRYRLQQLAERLSDEETCKLPSYLAKIDHLTYEHAELAEALEEDEAVKKAIRRSGKTRLYCDEDDNIGIPIVQFSNGDIGRYRRKMRAITKRIDKVKSLVVKCKSRINDIHDSTSVVREELNEFEERATTLEKQLDKPMRQVFGY